MKLTEREIEHLEDLIVLAKSRARGLNGIERARKHSQSLTQRAMIALTAGYIDDSVWYAEREFEFTGRFFGLGHEYARASFVVLDMLQGHRRAVAEQIEIELAKIA